MAQGTWSRRSTRWPRSSTPRSGVIQRRRVCVYHRGRPVVDAWSGVADRAGNRGVGQPGGVVLDHQGCDVDRPAHLRRPELVDNDDRVADHWPEFAQHGKDDQRPPGPLSRSGHVRRASFLERPEQILDWDAMVTGLEGMTPAFEPGRRTATAVTFGFIVVDRPRVSGLGSRTSCARDRRAARARRVLRGRRVRARATRRDDHVA